MKRARACVPLAVAIAMLSFVSAAHAESQAPVQKWTVVGLGDSVMSGWACECQTFLELYTDAISSKTHVRGAWTNFGALAQTSQDVLLSLETSSEVQSAVAQANIVAITVGANDFPPNHYLTSCPGLTCYKARAFTLRRNLIAIFHQIKALRNNQPTVVRITGYWEIWKDGDAGRALGQHYMFVNDFITHRINTIIFHAALDSGVGFVDLYGPFHGGKARLDDTGLLASDGDHPNAGGHYVIAQALLRSGLQPLA
ncbi:MAG: SGNH/GDSL hydrolase family protein [Actinomycetota bacterium]